MIEKRYTLVTGGTIPLSEFDFGVAKIAIGIVYDGELSIVYVPVGGKLRFNVGEVDIEITAELNGKIDIIIADAEVNVGAGAGVGAQVSRDRGFEVTSLRGLVVVRLDWSLLWYEDHWGKKWICDIWPVVRGTGPAKCFTEDASKPEGWRVMDRSYVNEGYAEFVGNLGISHSSPTTETLLVQNVFPKADPKLALNKVNDNLMLVYVHDDISKDITQSFEIFYTRWDGLSWDVPKPITDNDIADARPDLIFDSEGDAFAVWVSVNNSTLADETPISETVRYAEIAYSTFDRSVNEWTEPAFLTDNNIFDYDPMLAAGINGKVMAMWYADEDNSIFVGSEAEQEHDMKKNLYFSVWDGSAWSSPSIAVANVALSNKMAFDFTGAEAIVTWGEDMDGNSTTVDDREIIYSTWDGTSWAAPAQLTDNNFEDRIPTVIYDDDGRILLAWEGVERNVTDETLYRIYYSTFNGAWSEPIIITDTRQVEQLIFTENPQENPVLLWQTFSDQGTDIFYSVFDMLHNDWSAENLLTHDNSTDVSYSPVIDSNNDIISSYLKTEVLLVKESATVDDGNETFEITITKRGNSNIFVLTHHIFKDLEISDEDITLSNANPAPGEIITINANIHNVGDLSLDGITVRFSDGYPGSEIGRQIIGSISAGQNKTLSVDWKVPQDNQSHDIFVEVDPLDDIAEENETNNIATIKTVLPDMAIDFAVASYSSAETVTINANIINPGFVSASDIPVSFFFSDSPFFGDKTLIGTQTIGALGPNNSTSSVSIVWDTSTIAAGDYFVFVVVDPDNLILEGDETNNVDTILVRVFADLTIKDIVLPDVNEGSITIDVTVSNLGSFDAADVNLQVFEGFPFLLDTTPDFSTTNLFNSSRPSLVLNESLLILNKTIPLIGEKQDITVSGNWLAPAGDYDIYAIVDPNDLIKETDEFNNLGFIQTRILQRLVLTSLDAVDIDSDLIFDYVRAEVQANITREGNYYLTGTLDDRINVNASTLAFLGSGIHRIALDFSGVEIRGQGLDGPYTLRDVFLYDVKGIVGRLVGEFTTPAFNHTDFQALPLTLTGTFSDSGRDINADGLFDFLGVDVGIDVTKAGSYLVHGSLYDSNGNNIATFYDSVFLDVGIQTVLLRFDGTTIRENGVDGPYDLGSLIVYNENQDILINVVDGYSTSAYSHTDFSIERIVTIISLLQSVLNELQKLVNDNQGTPLADKLEDVKAKLQTALVELKKTTADNQAAAGNIEGVVGDLQAVVDAGLLDSIKGGNLMNQLTSASRLLATQAINQGIAESCDPVVINDAQQALAEGDALASSAAFKDAVAKYKDALAKAGSC